MDTEHGLSSARDFGQKLIGQRELPILCSNASVIDRPGKITTRHIASCFSSATLILPSTNLAQRICSASNRRSHCCHLHSTIAIHDCKMELDPPIRFGSLCPRCDKGMMKVKRRFPSFEKLGLTTVVYQCSECEHTVAQPQGARNV